MTEFYKRGEFWKLETKRFSKLSMFIKFCHEKAEKYAAKYMLSSSNLDAILHCLVIRSVRASYELIKLFAELQYYLLNPVNNATCISSSQ